MSMKANTERKPKKKNKREQWEPREPETRHRGSRNETDEEVEADEGRWRGRGWKNAKAAGSEGDQRWKKAEWRERG